MRYAYCVRKIPTSDDFANILDILKATNKKLQFWRAGSSYCLACKSSQQSVLNLISLECFFSMCLKV